MTISEVAQKYPEIIPIFMECGLHCVGCPAAPDETIEEAAQLHQIDLDKLLEKINQACSALPAGRQAAGRAAK